MKKLLKSLAVFASVVILLQGCYKINKPDNKDESSTSASSEYGTTQSTDETQSTTGSTTASTSSTTETSSSTQRSTTTVEEKSESTTSSTSASTQKKTEAPTKATTKSTTKATASHSVSSPTYISGILIANKTYALPSNYNPGVNSAAQSAFNTMAADAAKQGINLYIVSGFRSYSSQASIYNNYVARDGKAAADRYSARPGHSEHQTGLAFDVNSLSQSFENTAEGKWLAANCHNYGFIIRYPKGKESVTGYMYEPWHIRYLGTSTASAVHNSGLTLEEYLGINSAYTY